MDDRFDKDSTVFKPAQTVIVESKIDDWENAITLEEYFSRAFQARQENHPRVQKLRLLLPKTYDEVERKFRGNS